MSETITATPPAPGEIYPDAIGFGFAELVVLLNLQRGPAATASAHALRVQDELEEPQLLSAGASSLVARGAATVEPGGELSVAGPVAAVTRALTSATRRMQLTLLTADSADSVLSIESEDYRILLQPRAYLSWFAMAQRPDISPAEANFFIVRKHIEDNPAGGATLRRLEDTGGRQLLIKRSGDAWAVGYNEPSAAGGPIDEVSGLSDAEVLDRIRAIRQD
ncbi:hypothetical protein [Arthrobacter sp. ISL-65]|uniref:hypothetical protein n=1 Tax=Arthrobacter sp. ISL-65 TaxID=2819112 RepID=UPI001BE925DD|nr:hypothetical protein [Arthrobacter sp. ISL-65]MBT2547422.1 hypothetical protein [Arthrobacter sp. ISL-65]